LLFLFYNRNTPISHIYVLIQSNLHLLVCVCVYYQSLYIITRPRFHILEGILKFLVPLLISLKFVYMPANMPLIENIEEGQLKGTYHNLEGKVFFMEVEL